MNRRYPAAGLAIMTLALAGCANDPEQTPVPPSPHGVTSSWIPTPEQTIAEQALQVYRQYWQLREHADASPGSQDWRTSFAHLMADPALTTVVDELRNLASIPAHSVGQYHRVPKVRSVSTVETARVEIVDCLDTSAEHLVGDRPGQAGTNLGAPGRPSRYRLEAEVVRYPAPYRWLVHTIRPQPDRAC
jgi:hypothetical protein